jgi:equilibrative nucleoside transporter 1/2/3
MEADDDVFRQRAAVVAVVPGVEEIDDDEETPLIGHLSVQSSTSLTPPDDKKSLVYIVFFLVGMGTLLPWNFFISLNNFWDYKFREVGGGGGNSSEMLAKKSNSTAPSELQKEFTSYLAIASTVPNATFVIINACVGQRFDLRKRIKISLVIIIVMFTFVSALALADSDEWQRAFLVLILILVVIINMNSAIFQGKKNGDKKKSKKSQKSRNNSEISF